MTLLVSNFNLSQSFNYAPYLFSEKQFKSEINCFCIRTLGSVDQARTKLNKIYLIERAVSMILRYWRISGKAFSLRIRRHLKNRSISILNRPHSMLYI
jgi:hypothetical protein